MKFIDEVKIEVTSGHGGAGAVTFRREKYVPRGGPNGGDGGRGGHVVIKVDPHLNSLLNYHYQRQYKAQDGSSGAKKNCSGPQGEDLILKVPRGTLIRSSKGKLIADLSHQEEFYLMEGGRGGKGNSFFKSSIHQCPKMAQPGEPGVTLQLVLELKLLADIGLIGYPNAGKSTLLSRLSEARPKIADYPFTTLAPSLGLVKMDDEKSFVVADIPGLIPGAHKGVGLGIKFLKHIERTRVFVHLIDLNPLLERDPLQDYRDIRKELKEYDSMHNTPEYKPLLDRLEIVVLNKSDLLNERELLGIQRKFQSELGLKPYCISAVTGNGIKELIFAMGEKHFCN